MIIDSLSGGGAEKIALTLAKGFIERGHKVTIVVLKNVIAFDIPNGVNIVAPFSQDAKSTRGWFNQKSLAAILKRSLEETQSAQGKFDIVLVNLYESYRLCAQLDLPNMHWVIHNSFVQELKREAKLGPAKYFYLRSIIKKFNAKNLVAVSQGVADELHNATLFSAKQVNQIYNPFDIEETLTLADADVSANPDDTFPEKMPDRFILHVGRAAKAKRHDVLFEALKKVNQDYKLVCLSSNPKKLSKLAKKLGVEDRVILPGFSSNPFVWMKKAKVLALSSDFEGLPTVLIEALICNTPVVSTDCNYGPREILQGGLTDFLVPTRQPEALANAINKAIDYSLQESDKALLLKLGLADICNQYLALNQA